MIHLTYSNENSTFDLMRDDGQCIFYAGRIEEVDSFIENNLVEIDALRFEEQ